MIGQRYLPGWGLRRSGTENLGKPIAFKKREISADRTVVPVGYTFEGQCG